MKHSIKTLCLVFAGFLLSGQLPGFSYHQEVLDLSDVPVEPSASKATVESDSPTSGVPLADNSPVYTTPYEQYAKQGAGNKSQSSQAAQQSANTAKPIGQKQRTANESVVFKDSYQPYITNNSQAKPKAENTAAAEQKRRAANQSVVLTENYQPYVTKDGSGTQSKPQAAPTNVRNHRGVNYEDTTVEGANQNNTQRVASSQPAGGQPKPQNTANAANTQRTGVPYRAPEETPRYRSPYEVAVDSGKPVPPPPPASAQQRGVPYRNNNPGYQGPYAQYANQGTANNASRTSTQQANTAKPIGQKQRTAQDSVVFKESYTPIITTDGSGSQTKRQTASTNNNAGKNQYKGVPYQDNRPLYHTPYEQYANQGNGTGQKNSAKAQGTAANSGTNATRANTRSNGAVAYQAGQ